MENTPLLDKTTESEIADKKSRKKKARDIGAFVAQRQPAPEAHQLHGSQRRHERIGHMLVTAEAPASVRQAKAVEQDVARAATMQRAELLELSTRIMVDGTSLRQIYEGHLIGERGLRRLLAEHIRGGDLKKALRLEIVEHEIDFERDPAMRDLSHKAGQTAAPIAGSATAALSTLLEQAGESLPASREQAALLKARTDYQLGQQQDQHKKQRRLIDFTLVSAIIILIAAVIFLYLRGN